MTYTEWAEGHERKGFETGHEKGRTEQGQLMVLQMASRKFGTETAERLEELVGTMGPEQLIHVGAAVVDCETGDDLLTEAANGTSVAT